jgi:hypothetical protein
VIKHVVGETPFMKKTIRDVLKRTSGLERKELSRRQDKVE